MQNGMSVPICIPKSLSSCKDLSKLNSRLIPRIVAAASADPPAKPADTGISLSIVMVTPSF